MSSSLELPAGLVEEMLKKNDAAGRVLMESARAIQDNIEPIRRWLEDNGHIRNESNLPQVAIPTTCGIDGAYVIERLLSASIVACAAVAVEGFTPPSADKHWPLKYDSMIKVETHDPSVDTMTRGLMRMMETAVAVRAPHSVILLDGSVTSHVIHMNQAMSKAYDADKSRFVGKMLKDRYEQSLVDFKKMLRGADSKLWASLAKFTTRSEIGHQYSSNGWPEKQDDRSVMTAVLKPGEFTRPTLITTSSDTWHLKVEGDVEGIIGEITSMMDKHLVFYYKPKDYSPALRIEISGMVGKNDVRMAMLLRAIKYQYASYAIMEPYPLYMADRMVKSISGAVPVLRHAALQKIAQESDSDLEQILFGMRGYRTEGGR